MILRRFRPSPHDRNIRDLYGAIVAQARSAAFYRATACPIRCEGRFDLIVLHLVLVLTGSAGGARCRARHRPRAVRRVLPRSRRQSAGNGRRRSRGAEADARASARPFTAGRRPISPLLPPLTSGSLRRRSDAISLPMPPTTAGRCGSPIMCAPRGAGLKARRTRALLRGEVVFPQPECAKSSIMPKANSRRNCLPRRGRFPLWWTMFPKRASISISSPTPACARRWRSLQVCAICRGCRRASM